MNVFDFDNYKEFVSSWIKSQPKGGHGTHKQMAVYLRTSSVAVSQIFKSDRDLTVEQALDLCEFLGFTGLEAKYFLTLVSKARAGTQKLVKHFETELKELRKKTFDLKERLPYEHVMNEGDRAIFYSHWVYSAVRILSATGVNSLDQIASHLNFPRAKIKEVVDFLLRTGLCVENSEGALNAGTQRTHVNRDSLLVSRHHSNWRTEAIKRYENFNHEDEMAFTFPMALSHKAAMEVRKKLLALITEVDGLVKDSASERTSCLNIDWFQF